MIVPPACFQDVRRGFEYLQGCLDLAKTRSTDLRRDFAYARRKLADLKATPRAETLLDDVSLALRATEALAEQGDYDSALTALDHAMTLLPAESRLLADAPRIESRP